MKSAQELSLLVKAGSCWKVEYPLSTFFIKFRSQSSAWDIEVHGGFNLVHNSEKHVRFRTRSIWYTYSRGDGFPPLENQILEHNENTIWTQITQDKFEMIWNLCIGHVQP